MNRYNKLQKDNSIMAEVFRAIGGLAFAASGVLFLCWIF